MELTRFREFYDDFKKCNVLVDAKKVCALMCFEKNVEINLISSEAITLNTQSQADAQKLFNALAIWWKYWSCEGEKMPQRNDLKPIEN